MGRTDGGADFEPIREWDKSIPASPLASTTKKFSREASNLARSVIDPVTRIGCHLRVEMEG